MAKSKRFNNNTEDRRLPFSIEAEQKVLGAMLRDREAIHLAAENLEAESFYQPSHQRIFAALLELSSRNTAVDPVTLTNELERRGDLAAAGGPYYLIELYDCVTTAANIAHHSEIVKERALRRKLIHICSEIAKESFEGGLDIEELLSGAESSIFNISQNRKVRSFQPVGTFLESAIEKIQIAQQQKGSLTGITTGFRDLDKMTSGFQKSDLIVIAARPSVGKTSLVLNMAESVALTGAVVGVFSLEMSSEQIAERVLCSQARVNLKHLRSGFFTKREAATLLETAQRIHNLPLYIDDTPNLTPIEVMSRGRRLKSEHSNLGLLIIDYLQLMSTGRRDGNRQQEISEISRSLKILARDLDVPIIACSQLSRAVEKRDDHMPRLSDLRESGAIEQDADLVMFIHRESLKEEFEGEEEDYDAGQQHHYSYKLIIGKHRNGPVGEVEIYFASQYTKFYDAAQPEVDDGEVPF